MYRWRTGRIGAAAAVLGGAVLLLAAPVSGETANVEIANSAFTPQSIRVQMTAGEPGFPAAHAHVMWFMRDLDTEHSVTFDDARLPSSGRLTGGQTHNAVLTEAGTFTYRCSLHGETGTLTVLAAAPVVTTTSTTTTLAPAPTTAAPATTVPGTSPPSSTATTRVVPTTTAVGPVSTTASTTIPASTIPASTIPASAVPASTTPASAVAAGETSTTSAPPTGGTPSTLGEAAAARDSSTGRSSSRGWLIIAVALALAMAGAAGTWGAARRRRH